MRSLLTHLTGAAMILLGFCVVPNQADATFIIDDFSVAQLIQDGAQDDLAPGDFSAAVASGLVGGSAVGQRDLIARMTDPAMPGALDKETLSSSGGVLTFDQGIATTIMGISTAVYDGATATTDPLAPDTTGLLVDATWLNPYDRFTLSDVRVVGGAIDVFITLWDGDSSSTVMLADRTGGNTPEGTDLHFLFANFAGIDFTDIRAIVLGFDTRPVADGGFGASGPGADMDVRGALLVTTSVPEPATALLWSVGAFGLVATRRFRRNK